MGKTTKLFSGFDWSLSRFHDTKTALRAERTFNEKVKSEGLTSTWNVGISEVHGKLGEQHLKAELDQWREESVLRAIEDEIGPSKWLTRFTSKDQYNLQNRCLDRDQRRTYWSIIHDVNQQAKDQGMKNSVQCGPLGDHSTWTGSAIVIVAGYRWKCESINGDGVFTKCGKVES